jgi:leukotriene-A4 hydrolase
MTQSGDKSLSDVIAHEIAHSWTGNLVTNTNFEHFWLNEGFTVFTERKILREMSGKAAQHFSAAGGWKDLAEEVRSYFDKKELIFRFRFIY